MSVGFAATKTAIDNRAGQLSVELRDCLQRIKLFQAYLAATPDGNLTALGFTSGEVATLKSAYVDLDKLRQIYEGTATQSPVYDFTQFAKQLNGVV